LLRLRASCQGLGGHSRGFTLIEVLIALAILAIVAVAFLTALTTASTALILADERTTAESLTRAQLEYVKSQPYNSTAAEASYRKIPPEVIPEDYVIKGLGEDGYVSYPPVNYAGETNELLGVAWNSTNGTAAENNTGLQIVTVIIYHDGTRVLTTTTYKVE
jgi:prepilin-type N-terminal cleavage/methylation domain-containing protein